MEALAAPAALQKCQYFGGLGTIVDEAGGVVAERFRSFTSGVSMPKMISFSLPAASADLQFAPSSVPSVTAAVQHELHVAPCRSLGACRSAHTPRLAGIRRSLGETL